MTLENRTIGKIRGDLAEVYLSGHDDGEPDGWNSIGVGLGDDSETITVQEAREFVRVLNQAIELVESEQGNG